LCLIETPSIAQDYAEELASVPASEACRGVLQTIGNQTLAHPDTTPDMLRADLAEAGYKRLLEQAQDLNSTTCRVVASATPERRKDIVAQTILGLKEDDQKRRAAEEKFEQWLVGQQQK
jgi:hypothetical protein